MGKRTKHLQVLAGLALTVSFIGACGSGESGTPSGQERSPGDTEPSASQGGGVPSETGLVGVRHTEKKAQAGGTLTIGVWGEARDLDPAVTTSAGVIGGMEMAAIYDVLVRYEPATGGYQPWMAKSLQHNEGYTTWTLRLREDVHFSDGTPLDAEAVVFNFRRAQEGLYGPLVNQISKMETPNPRTVVFQLRKAWSQFPYVLSVGPGRPVSPSAAKKWGEDLKSHPIGCGPFVLEHWNAGEEMVLIANKDYWGEGPYLDKLRFVPLGGDQARLDALEAEGIQVAYLRDAKVIASAREAGFGGFVNVVSSSAVLAINNREGFPGHDPRVREAIAYAIDLEQFNQRVYDGKGLVQKEFIASTSRWATEADATKYDPTAARALLTEAKAAGYDGTLVLSSDSSPTGQNKALAIQAQLNAVGFDVSIEQAPNSAAHYRQLVEGSFELTFSGASVPDAAPFRIIRKLKSDGSANYTGYADAEMDSLLASLDAATSEAETRSVLNKIQKLWTETVPLVPLAAVPNFIVWDETVHGVVPTVRTTVVLSRTWLSD